MAATGKWLTGVSPHDPVERVARRALKRRLAVVLDHLPLAARHAHRDPEHVHQLRVATRRAAAALRLFLPLLPPRRALRVQKRLRRARRAAAAARDLDVMLLRLDQLPPPEAPANWAPLRARLIDLRRQAQVEIVRVHRRLTQQGFAREISRLLSRVRLRSKSDKLLKPTFGYAARRALRVLAEDFFAAADVEAASLEQLHAFRIQGKQLRYAMELFAVAFPPPFTSEVYPAIEQLQELLGTVNDLATSQAQLRGWVGRSADAATRRAVARVLDLDQQALAVARAEFHHWWTPQRCESLRGTLADCLTVEVPRLRA